MDLTFSLPFLEGWTSPWCPEQRWSWSLDWGWSWKSCPVLTALGRSPSTLWLLSREDSTQLIVGVMFIGKSYIHKLDSKAVTSDVQSSIFFWIIQGTSWRQPSSAVDLEENESEEQTEDDSAELLAVGLAHDPIGHGQLLCKRNTGNPILNTLSKSTSAIFSACKRPTDICLQP